MGRACRINSTRPPMKLTAAGESFLASQRVRAAPFGSAMAAKSELT